MTERVVEYAKDPVLKLQFLSHGTLESFDLEKTRHFYTDFLGLEVVRTSPISLIIRLGGTNTIAVVQNPKRGGGRRTNVTACRFRKRWWMILLRKQRKPGSRLRSDLIRYFALARNCDAPTPKTFGKCV